MNSQPKQIVIKDSHASLVKSPIKVLVTTSGVGSRLGEFTTYTNKSLVKVGDKLALSHIIDCYPIETKFVITLGHHGKLVQDFLELSYPQRDFVFVSVPKYEGPGSSLGLSLLSASHLLQEPFIFHASDTLISADETQVEVTEDWVAGCKGLSAAQYSSFDASFGKVMKFHSKGSMKFDFIHIGLVGIYSYKEFWASMKREYDLNPNDHSLNDLSALKSMMADGVKIKIKEIKTWIDIGNTESLASARNLFGQKHEVLEKADESICFVEGSVVKFFADEVIASNRVKRAELLGGIIPQITGNIGNFYKYDFVDGKLISDLISPPLTELLLWSEENLWKKRDTLSADKFRALCLDFYKIKTISRITTFLEKSKFDESNSLINGLRIPSIFDLMNMINFDDLSNGIQSQIHGDFILDNILQTQDGFKLIDWRQDFAGNLESGDMYYDLAKLNHSLTISHEIVNLNHYKILITDENVECEIYRRNELVHGSHILESYISNSGYDLKKVRLLTAIIWLNMSPLHNHPFDLFLFNFGKLNLWRALQHG
jgi:NDP-sugar pyrophosphorylase family protein